MRKTVACALLILSSVSWAEESGKLTVLMVYGEANSSFVADGKKMTVEMTTSTQPARQNKISQANFRYLISEFKKLKPPPQVPDVCYRNNMLIRYQEAKKPMIEKASCFGIKTISSDEFQRFANMLTMLF